MQRRPFVLALGTLGVLPPAARAHHGWSSFDQDRPVYLEGRAERVAWGNPHAEVWLRVAPSLALPADLKTRAVPKQSADVDGAAVLAKTTLPRRKDPLWEIELAPLSRMNAWQVPEIKAGQALAVVGFTFADEKGAATLRAEYLFVDGKAYGLRSSPA
jgi:hypothetical protein